MFDLNGHVALVTGGNGGIGLAFARGLVKCGARVAIWGRNPEKNAAALSELEKLGGDVAAFACDVLNVEDVATNFAKTVDHFGQVDSCFANAGGSGKPGRLHELTDQDWHAVVDLNLNSVVNTYRPVINHLIERDAPGKLVVTSSIAAHLGIGNGAGYSATKAAVAGLTRALAVELGRNNIQVNAVLPGFVETEMSVNTPKYFQDGARRRTASGVIGSLEDMEGIAVFLASQESNYITGQEIVIDGGQSIFPM